MTHEGQGLLLDVLSADQLTANYIDMLNRRAEQFQQPNEISKAGEELNNLYRAHTHLGRLAVYFWFEEPSTRTVGSFDAARDLLGIGKLGVTSAKEASSSAKGETFRDAMRTAKAHLGLYGGAVVVARHPEIQSAYEAADIHDFPVINAGNGQDQHPTQALLDMYTIWRRHGRLDNLKVAMGGDPRYSRTIHSLAETLSLYDNNEVTFVGGSDLWIPEDDLDRLQSKGLKTNQTKDMDVLQESDVVYWTRLQKERFNGLVENVDIEEQYRKYLLNEVNIRYISKNASVMHPLPRGDEIPESFDDDPRAAYWNQVENSVPLRAALLEMVFRNYYVTKRT